MTRFLCIPAAPLFDRTARHRGFVPTGLSFAGALSGGPGRPSGRREGALLWTGARPAARGWPIGIAFALSLAMSASPSGSVAQPTTPGSATCRSDSVASVTQTIAEAARRFGVPELWVRAVMRVESAGRVCAVSHAGAMGLMQVMPATYAELRARYRLGPDPFDVRDNLWAGVAYLRELCDRYGAPGCFAAYNAGPGRYEQSLAGRPLPAETRAYVARLSQLTGLAGAPTVSSPPPQPRLDSLTVALRSPLFATAGALGSGSADVAAPPSDDPPVRDRSSESPSADGLFIPVSTEAVPR